MKIIGTAENGHMLLSARPDEVAKLAGIVKRGRVSNLSAFQPGTEFEISDAWDRVERLKNLPDTLLELRSLALRIHEAVESTRAPVLEELSRPLDAGESDATSTPRDHETDSQAVEE